MAVIETAADQAALPPPSAIPTIAPLSLVALAASALAACGGGGGASPAAPGSPVMPATPATPATPVDTAPVPDALTAVTASRFLAQASMGATREQIARVQTLGYAGWIDEQMDDLID